ELQQARRRAEAVSELASANGCRHDRRSVGVTIYVEAGLDSREGDTVVGAVTGVGADDTTLSVACSAVGPRHKLAAWLRLVLLSAHDPSTPWRAVHVGRCGGRGDAWAIGPLADSAEERGSLARRHLAELAELWSIGMRS